MATPPPRGTSFSPALPRSASQPRLDAATPTETTPPTPSTSDSASAVSPPPIPPPQPTTATPADQNAATSTIPTESPPPPPSSASSPSSLPSSSSQPATPMSTTPTTTTPLPPQAPPPPASPTTYATAASPRRIEPTPPPPDAFRPHYGSQDVAFDVALRNNKWLLVLLIPRPPRLPPRILSAPQAVRDAVILARYFENSSEASRYSSFYPVDDTPHAALLDPRSRERLVVWHSPQTPINVDDDNDFKLEDVNPQNNESTAETDYPPQDFWEEIMSSIIEFLPNHSLESFELGPMHRAEKSHAARTRRGNQHGTGEDAHNVTSSLMDDEQAAIDAAIAASLLDVESAAAQRLANTCGNADDEDENEDVEDVESGSASGLTSSAIDLTMSEDASLCDVTPHPSSSTPIVISGRTRRTSSGLGSVEMGTPTAPSGSTPAPIAPIPSSVESLSSSYVERMSSTLRSATDPALREARRLRAEQDGLLAASAAEDRARAESQAADERRRAAGDVALREAKHRLQEEPGSDDLKAFTVALRFADGRRFVRRFDADANLSQVRDFVAVVASRADVLGGEKVNELFAGRGVNFDGVTWEDRVGACGLAKKDVLMVNL